ncbi:uncharacterized protein LOC111864133 isoform X3 [Cryptotermes secundus]|uniref:uncharacterized protein LOC111864133 isoform X3 n=1 Tax=Cryptotermes secundus TaxID=105785 RepID=UPI000CD7D097|nr:uncharacterized protein LOC111864133 isoform X3 [Cryptotermes secundus]XP_023706939.1 uncharacterized protein LOC111864133 isoform X3 [Cryptotermes secundus]XP_023706940.1 uncharacterized protein LOC111864133 isoform X3 [Cryptotermes secundus]XP_023706941.1 uncharacterized protein LOC111864133 isoform X3 [Cryptotermes secundus]
MGWMTEGSEFESWPECQAQVLKFSDAKFHKFSTETEAINFVNKYGEGDLGNKTQHTHVEKSGENVSQQLIMNTTDVMQSAPGISEVPNMSSLQLKTSALKQRLSVLQKKFEVSMEELRTEIDTFKERIETFDTKVNVRSNNKTGDEGYMTEELKVLQDGLSQLAKHYTDSITELKAEISSLKQAVRELETEEGQTKTNSEEGACAGSNSLSFKRNLTSVLEAVGPSTTAKRSYSTEGCADTKTAKRKYIASDKGAGPSKTLIVEPPDSDDEKNSKNNTSPGFDTDENGYVHVYTDGACENNGRVGARAGIGVWFADNHPLNYSERVRGRLTNNTAEIKAATCAIELAKKAGVRKLLLHTDSQFLISCITVWIHKWKQNGWKLSDGGQVKNKEDLIELDQALEGISVKWDHVRGHRGNLGNEMADSLARAGARMQY